ncbi:MAG TPA: hypothetical protein VFS14_00810, partial [Candidatus Saccharimonadales bacterium]|nr:hypothetical protein [Candidatus Saccharimonadales bacterium]
MKVAIISCYDQIDYIRTRVLRTGFGSVPGVQTIIVKNTHRGLLRYLETPLKILRCKFRDKPDAYVVTFRGYEMLPLVLLLKGRKPLIFDEMINAAEYLAEHHVLSLDSRLGKLFRWWYGSLLRRCRFVLADTDAHAALSAKLCKVDKKKFLTVPISTDEATFYPRKQSRRGKAFNVFYYGVMRPLHGFEYVLEAAVRLADNPNITFTVGGDKGKSEAACQAAIAKGARITYMPWVPFDDIPKIASRSGLSLGGPFGKTFQSQFIITTKTFQFLACRVPVLVGRN